MNNQTDLEQNTPEDPSHSRKMSFKAKGVIFFSLVFLLIIFFSYFIFPDGIVKTILIVTIAFSGLLQSLYFLMKFFKRRSKESVIPLLMYLGFFVLAVLFYELLLLKFDLLSPMIFAAVLLTLNILFLVIRYFSDFGRSLYFEELLEEDMRNLSGDLKEKKDFLDNAFVKNKKALDHCSVKKNTVLRKIDQSQKELERKRKSLLQKDMEYRQFIEERFVEQLFLQELSEKQKALYEAKSAYAIFMSEHKKLLFEEEYWRQEEEKYQQNVETLEKDIDRIVSIEKNSSTIFSYISRLEKCLSRSDMSELQMIEQDLINHLNNDTKRENMFTEVELFLNYVKKFLGNSEEDRLEFREIYREEKDMKELYILKDKIKILMQEPIKFEMRKETDIVQIEKITLINSLKSVEQEMEDARLKIITVSEKILDYLKNINSDTSSSSSREDFFNRSQFDFYKNILHIKIENLDVMKRRAVEFQRQIEEEEDLKNIEKLDISMECFLMKKEFIVIESVCSSFEQKLQGILGIEKRYSQNVSKMNNLKKYMEGLGEKFKNIDREQKAFRERLLKQKKEEDKITADLEKKLQDKSKKLLNWRFKKWKKSFSILKASCSEKMTFNLHPPVPATQERSDLDAEVPEEKISDWEGEVYALKKLLSQRKAMGERLSQEIDVVSQKSLEIKKTLSELEVTAAKMYDISLDFNKLRTKLIFEQDSEEKDFASVNAEFQSVERTLVHIYDVTVEKFKKYLESFKPQTQSLEFGNEETFEQKIAFLENVDNPDVERSSESADEMEMKRDWNGDHLKKRQRLQDLLLSCRRVVRDLSEEQSSLIISHKNGLIKTQKEIITQIEKLKVLNKSLQDFQDSHVFTFETLNRTLGGGDWGFS